MEYSFLFPLMQNYENRSRNARLIVEKLLASFFRTPCRLRHVVKHISHIFYCVNRWSLSVSSNPMSWCVIIVSCSSSSADHHGLTSEPVSVRRWYSHFPLRHTQRPSATYSMGQTLRRQRLLHWRQWVLVSLRCTDGRPLTIAECFKPPEPSFSWTFFSAASPQTLGHSFCFRSPPSLKTFALGRRIILRIVKRCRDFRIQNLQCCEKKWSFQVRRLPGQRSSYKDSFSALRVVKENDIYISAADLPVALKNQLNSHFFDPVCK